MFSLATQRCQLSCIYAWSEVVVHHGMIKAVPTLSACLHRVEYGWKYYYVCSRVLTSLARSVLDPTGTLSSSPIHFRKTIPSPCTVPCIEQGSQIPNPEQGAKLI